MRPSRDKALAVSETRFGILSRNCPAMVVIVDADFRVVSANPITETLLGYAISELHGHPVTMVFGEEDRAAVVGNLRSCLQHPEKVHHWKFRKVRKDGVSLWVEELVQAVPSVDGGLEIMVVCQDVTEKRRTQEEIERLNVELQARAADLEAANRELDAFNHTAAHDLRQPLSVLSSYCQVIEELCTESLSQDCKEMIHEVYNITLRMDQQISALLRFSMVGGVESSRQPVNLSMLAQEVAQTLKVMEPERQVEFRIEDDIVANCDKNLIRTVLENLFGNAWKYTGTRKKALIKFGMKEVGGVPTYYVWDNGVGFSMADAERLFTPFVRLAGSEESRGFGIGLATVDRIVRRHGGRVCAEGVLGEWACLYFTLNGA